MEYGGQNIWAGKRTNQELLEANQQRSTDLIVDVLLELLLLPQGLETVFSIHPPQHLILQLLPGVGQATFHLGSTKTEKRL